MMFDFVSLFLLYDFLTTDDSIYRTHSEVKPVNKECLLPLDNSSNAVADLEGAKGSGLLTPFSIKKIS
jgi:hypothetical protein